MELLIDAVPGPSDAPEYAELLHRADLSVGVYTIPAGGVDAQSPHTEDEVYVCVAGSAVLWTPDASAAMRPGSVAFVPAGEEHRFVEVSEDFAVVVAFGPAEGARRPAGQDDIILALAERGEVDVATTMADGSAGWVPFWVARVGEGLFARSYRGVNAAWWRNATASGAARLRLGEGEAEHDFAVTLVGPMLREQIDDAYRAAFTGPDAEFVPPMVSDETAETTVRFRLLG